MKIKLDMDFLSKKLKFITVSIFISGLAALYLLGVVYKYSNRTQGVEFNVPEIFLFSVLMTCMIVSILTTISILDTNFNK